MGVLALQDMLLLVYLVIVRLLLLRVEPGPAQAACAHRIEACIAITIAGALLARALPGVPALVRRTLYRLTLAGMLLVNYLILRDILPIIRPDSVDALLLRIDIFVFGAEPALLLEALNTRPIVEWFSFFYFSYFWICFGYMLFIVWLSRAGRQTTEFALGTLIVFCIGQLGYMAVPGYGPYKYLVDQFHGPIAGGFFWNCVWQTVQAGGAMKDIFPSLHTAAPLWFTLFAFERARHDRRWLWPARVTGFFAANIIFSTVFLRWHYVIDVVAGLLLAFTAGTLAPHLARIEEQWRSRHSFAAPWSFDR
jgi:membrane-associated phospholipid phosphatase